MNVVVIQVQSGTPYSDSSILEKKSNQIDEDINTSATIIPSIEIVGPITRS
jgi:hypothetical protein